MCAKAAAHHERLLKRVTPLRARLVSQGSQACPCVRKRVAVQPMQLRLELSSHQADPRSTRGTAKTGGCQQQATQLPSACRNDLWKEGVQ